MFMAFIKNCVILIGIRVKEQTAELMDINSLDLPVVVIINCSFSSRVLHLCRLVSGALLIPELNMCLYDREDYIKEIQ